MLRKISLIILMSLIWATSVQPQEVSGHLEGRVLDGQGVPLSEVNVTVKGPSLQGERGTVTDERGYFRVLSLPVGVYGVGFSHVAYQVVEYQEVAIHLGQTHLLGEVQLQKKTVDVAEIVISGQRPIIDPTTSSTGGNLQARIYESLPTERSFRSIISLLPQANTSYLGDETNIGGATGLENMYFIDGVNVTSPYDGATSTNLPYNFIKEIEVKEGGYEAEFGRAMGGIVNVVTYSGSNEFHGGAFGFLTNSALAGEARRGLADAKVEDFSTYDFGLSLGGPIVRDRLWFFAAYNASFEDKDIEIASLGVKEDRRRVPMYAGKLNWRAGENTDVTFSFFGDPATHSQVRPWATFLSTPAAVENLDPLLLDLEDGGINYSAQVQHRVGNSFLIDASAARYEAVSVFRGKTEMARTEPLYIDQETSTWSGGVGRDDDGRYSRTSGKIHGTLFLGRHTFKGGVEYEDNMVDGVWGTIFPGLIEKNGEGDYEALYFNVADDVHNLVPTAFAQDSWQMSERLRLNAGLRWDGQFFVGKGDSVVQDITDQFQPRAGFVFQPDAFQKISGSLGRFYQQAPLRNGSDVFIGSSNGSRKYSEDPRLNPDNPDTVVVYSSEDQIYEEVDGLQGEHFDELTLGYERVFEGDFKVGVRGIYRTLRQAYISGRCQGMVFFANPGEEDLSCLPKAERNYAALELTVERTAGSRLDFAGSYVLSRTHGNYTGLFSSDTRFPNPGNNFSLQWEEQAVNSKGLLPNDRTHVFKIFGLYRVNSNLTAGTFFTWQSGTPLNEFGQIEFGFGRPLFLVERGSAGRSPAIWDLNLRLVYDVPSMEKAGFPGRLILDLMHVGSRRKAVNIDEWRYNSFDSETGEQANPNPNFGKAFGYQPPMTARLGFEIDF